MLTSTTLDCGRASWLIPRFPVASAAFSQGAAALVPCAYDHAPQAPNIPTGRGLLQTSDRVPCADLRLVLRRRAANPTGVRIKGVQSATRDPGEASTRLFWPGITPGGERSAGSEVFRVGPAGSAACRGWGAGRRLATHRRRPALTSPGDTQRRAPPRVTRPGRGAIPARATYGSASAVTRSTAFVERGVTEIRLPPSARFTPADDHDGDPSPRPTDLLKGKLTRQ